MQIMYKAINNSPITALSAEITAVAATIAVIDGTKLPVAPNIVTLCESLSDENAELIAYAGKTGNTLTGCIRGFNGTTPSVWGTDTLVLRAYSAYDQDTFIANIADLEAGKIDKAGEINNTIVSFTPSIMRQNVTSGESQTTLWGKVSKFFADLKQGAFRDVGSDAGMVAAGDHTHAIYAARAQVTDVILAAAMWVEETTGWSQVISNVSGASASALIEWGVPATLSDMQAQAAANAQIRCIKAGTGTLTFRAIGEVPTADIPIIIKVVEM